MRALLDTHALLFWLIDSERLSPRARKVLRDPDSELHWSAASSWELAIKSGLGRVTLPERARSFIPKILRQQSLLPLDVTHAHALEVEGLPDHHRDPFDRLLVAQAKLERLPILTADPVFRKYGVRTLW